MLRGYDIVIELLSGRLGAGYVAYVPELRGCIAHGDTREEAIENLDDAIRCWLEYARISGRKVPEPPFKLPSRV